MSNKNFGFGTQIRKSPYFDSVSNTISSGTSSTTAMEGSTESEQF